MGRRSTKHTSECELKARKVGHSNAGTEQVSSGPVDEDAAINNAELVNAKSAAVGTDGGDVVESVNEESSNCIIA